MDVFFINGQYRVEWYKWQLFELGHLEEKCLKQVSNPQILMPIDKHVSVSAKRSTTSY